MVFHGVDVRKQFKKMRELAPDTYKAFVDFDTKAMADGAIPSKTKHLMGIAIAHITQCPWCIDTHTRKATKLGATEQEIAETIFVAMALSAGAAWSHGGLTLQCLEEHAKPAPTAP
jgi:AhpD family alkylhydroperoxidase